MSKRKSVVVSEEVDVPVLDPDAAFKHNGVNFVMQEDASTVATASGINPVQNKASDIYHRGFLYMR
ncbi:hypothetical protein HN014_19745 [Aquimarina sp. TRL1]|uniref:hypothetical protein n=1 Tax=Aquimarina sp. (strain TRL1) TaxID=2736252 RepID=UPI00158C9647|nr:hypothetical protein [Aquimarina sp. TRL1]QKX07051.1 hypothetical protein HN014_19745 [Aquimarina sp. TRL1]